VQSAVFGTVPVLRSSAEEALHRARETVIFNRAAVCRNKPDHFVRENRECIAEISLPDALRCR
jgi:hypothetical protein